MTFFKNLLDALAEAAVGIGKQAQHLTVDLLKLEATACYLKGVRLLRQQVVLIVKIVACLFVFAIGVIAIPLAAVFLLPWGGAAKLAAFIGVGILYVTLPLLFLRRYLSEAKWLEISKSKELLEQVMPDK